MIVASRSPQQYPASHISSAPQTGTFRLLLHNNSYLNLQPSISPRDLVHSHDFKSHLAVQLQTKVTSHMSSPVPNMSPDIVDRDAIFKRVSSLTWELASLVIEQVSNLEGASHQG